MRRGLLRATGGLGLAVALFVWSPVGAVPWRLAVGDVSAAPTVDAGDLPAIDPPGEREPLGGRQGSDEVTPPREKPPVRPRPFDPERPPVPPSEGAIDQERSSADRLVWRNADGSMQAQMASLPRWYRGPSGRWEPIDVSLVPVEGASGVVRTAAAAWSATFAPIGRGVGGVSVRAEDGSVLSWRPANPTATGLVVPEVAADQLSVTYRGLWPGADLRYRVSSVGLKEEVVIASPDAVSAFEFEIDRRLERDVTAEEAARAV